jgi:hypothetical protein
MDHIINAQKDVLEGLQEYHTSLYDLRRYMEAHLHEIDKKMLAVHGSMSELKIAMLESEDKHFQDCFVSLMSN